MKWTGPEAGPVFFCLEMVVHGFGMGQDMAGVMEKFQSCWREGDAVAVPFDQGQGKLFFQIFDSRAQAGLGDVQGMGCSRNGIVP